MMLTTKLGLILAGGVILATSTVASAFHQIIIFRPPGRPAGDSHTSTTSSTCTSSASRVQPLPAVSTDWDCSSIDIQETAYRDVFSMKDWARTCGVQSAEGFQLTSRDKLDYSAATSRDLPAGSPVLLVPAQMVLSSSAARHEFGSNLDTSEDAIAKYGGARNRLPLFRLMVKILVEYERGDQSPYHPWLNSLPRRFYNGVAMTDACFECLPPYVSWLAQKERNNYSKFLNGLRKGGYSAPLSGETLNDDNLIKWAYNVALTRHNIVVAGQEKKIAPMADMFNHGTYPNCEITYDLEGNCMVSTIADVPAGSPLSISLGDPTNPSPLFATYGFLDDDCSAIFCKAMDLEEMEELGLGFKDLLFATETGDISPQVWDLFLYKLLRNANDENLPAFFEACTSGDESAKQAYHGQYFPYTLAALNEHVDNVLRTVDSLTMKANSYDLNTHPRVPVIVAHNELVKRTFLKVQGQLNALG